MIIKWTIFLVFAVCSAHGCPAICICDDNSTDCSSNAISELPDHISTRVRFLDLSHNRFVIIPPRIKAFADLERLSLRGNNIHTLDLEALKGLTQLKELDLAGNRLSQVDTLVDAALPALVMLDMSHNPLKYFPLLQSDSLQRLLLEDCHITELYEDNMLMGMPHLKDLNLSGNKISSLSSQIKSTTLESLDLSKCEIYEISMNTFVNLPSLKRLHLAGNTNLRQFEEGASSVLEHLDLSGCSFESLPMLNLPNLTYIDISGNRLRKIKGGVFMQTMPNIRIVNITHNMIDTVELLAFGYIENLTLVDLSYNIIDEMHPKTFASNNKLHKLFLSHNYFKKLISFEINSLRHLDMSECEIASINQLSLTKMPHLRFLNLSGNIFSSVPNDFVAKNLQLLDLSYCRITNIRNETFKMTPNLKHLNLSGNRLVEIRAEYLKDITKVDLSDNSWRCDCHDEQFKHLYFNLTSRTDFGQLTCTSPEAVEGKLWREACGTWYITNHKNKLAWIYASVSAILILTGITILTFINQSRRRKEQIQREEETEQEQSGITEILHRMQRMEAAQSEGSNAPNPRELERPPSYNDAISMMQYNNNNKKQRTRRKRRKSKSENVRDEPTMRPQDENSDNEANLQPAAPLESDV